MESLKNKGKAQSKTFLAVVAIIIVVYNVVVFALPFKKDGNFWTGYGFSVFAMLLTAAISFYAFKRDGLRSKVYGVPLTLVIWRYLIIQMIVGFLEMSLQFIPYDVPFQYGLALNTILLGACIIGLITVGNAKEVIERIDEKIKEKVFYIKSLQADVEGLAGKASDDSVKKLLKNVAETIRYSDPMSNPQLAATENKIEAKVVALTEAVEKVDWEAVKILCDELQQLFAERNRKCKILK